MLHSLESYNYLKLDPGNYLMFEGNKKTHRTINIQQEYKLTKAKPK